MSIIRKTILKDEGCLRQISKEVNFGDKSYLDDIKQLEEYCLNNRVFALAPVQIGIPKRIIYLRNTTSDMMKNADSSYNEAKILINPKILVKKGHTKFLERCSSCLDYVGIVDRPYVINVEYYDINGNKHVEEFCGFETTVICHEYDHLEGILHIDLVDDVMKMTIDETKRYRDKNPYQIISEDCDFAEKVTKRKYNK